MEYVLGIIIIIMILGCYWLWKHKPRNLGKETTRMFEESDFGKKKKE